MRENHLSLHNSGCSAVSDASISADQPKRMVVFYHLPILFFCWLAAVISSIAVEVLTSEIIPHNNFKQFNARKGVVAQCSLQATSDRRSHI